jgi:hypothetical protein
MDISPQQYHRKNRYLLHLLLISNIAAKMKNDLRVEV